MTTISAGLVTIDGPLNVTSSSSGAVKTTQLNVPNGTVNALNLITDTLNTTNLDLSGNLNVHGNFTTGNIVRYDEQDNLTTNVYIDTSGNINLGGDIQCINDIILTQPNGYNPDTTRFLIGSQSLYQYIFQFPENTTQEIINNVISVPESVFDEIGINGPDLYPINETFTDVSGTYIVDSSNVKVVNDGSGNAIPWNGQGEYPFLTNTLAVVFSEFCPPCAFERWPLLIALSRFGTFKGIENMQSSSADTIGPGIQSFTLRDLMYTSEYFTLETDEKRDIFRNTLQTPTSYYEDVYTSLYPNRYTTPFMSFGNVYTSISQAPYDILSGLSRSNISNHLTDTSNTVTQNIIASANYLTACISLITGNKPENVCNSPGVVAAKVALGIK